MSGTPTFDWTAYTIRESRRAKRVIFKVSVAAGLEVVVPVGFDRRRLAAIVETKREWIERSLKQAAEARHELTPRQILLPALAETWEVRYQPSRGAEAPSLTADGHRKLVVEGDTSDALDVAALLKSWLQWKGRLHLVPWLVRTSDDIGVPFRKAIVRGQSTRWASCSERHTISLNRNLLFLPKHLVRHVLLHELCHVKRLDHSPGFWKLLGRLEPDPRTFERELRRMADCVPQWALRR